MEWTMNEYKISTDKSLLQVDAVYDYLSHKSYWAQGRTREQVQKSIDNCLCFGVYHNGRQIGFARVLTDYAVIYNLYDVFILEEYRGNGLGKWLIECVTGHPDLKPLIGGLATRDAHGLYEKYGFKAAANPSMFMRKEAK